MDSMITTYLRLILAVGLWLGGEVRGQELEVVLSSDLGPYREAYAGFTQAMGYTVPVVDLNQQAPRIDRRTRVVVAFGSKAALAEYPEEVALVYSMAPGTMVPVGKRRGVTIKIALSPQPQAFLAAVRKIQPELRRLAVLWIVEASEEYYEQIVQAGSRMQVEVLAEKLQNPDELPDRLRDLVRQKADALWLLPDPLLINPQSIAVIKDFSWANDVPFYAPTAGFAEAGATASIAASFQEVGRETAEAVQRILEGQQVPAFIYPHQLEITLSLNASGNAGLRIPEEVLSRFDKVVP